MEAGKCPLGFGSSADRPLTQSMGPPRKKIRLAFVGHVSLDVNVINKETRHEAGGGVYFGSVAASNLGMDVAAVITKCAASDIALFADTFQSSGMSRESLHFLPSHSSTSCRNEYPTSNPDDRIQRMLSLAAPFSVEDLSLVPKDGVLIVNPLWYGEFPPELLSIARHSCTHLVGDAQGFLRHVADGKMSLKDWEKKREYLGFFDLFKVDTKEAKVLTGTDDLREAVKLLHSFGAKMVLATHAEGIVLYDGVQLYSASFHIPPKMEGRTGRGDTVTVAFISAGGLEPSPWKHAVALEFAANVTALKMQYPGPYQKPVASL